MWGEGYSASIGWAFGGFLSVVASAGTRLAGGAYSVFVGLVDEDEVLFEAEHVAEFAADTFHELGEGVEDGEDGGGVVVLFESGAGEIEGVIEGVLAEERFEAVSDDETGEVASGVDAEEEVAVFALFGGLPGDGSGVEEPEEVGAEREFRIEVAEDDGQPGLGEALMEIAQGAEEAFFVPRAEGVGEVGDAIRREPRHRTHDGAGAVEVEAALGTHRGGLGERSLTVGALNHPRRVPGEAVRLKAKSASAIVRRRGRALESFRSQDGTIQRDGGGGDRRGSRHRAGGGQGVCGGGGAGGGGEPERGELRAGGGADQRDLSRFGPSLCGGRGGPRRDAGTREAGAG